MTQNSGRRRKKRANYFDYNLLTILIFLLCFGLIMLYSTSAFSAQSKFGDDMYYFRKQAMISAGSLAVMFVIAFIDYHFWEKFAFLGFVIAEILLILVQTPLGQVRNGARRWLGVGETLTFQPAELSKIAVILFLPFVICKMGKKIKTFKGICLLLAIGFLVGFSVYEFTDNLSTGIIIIGMTMIIVFVIHPKTIPFVGLGVGITGLIIAGVSYLEQHINDSGNFRIRRILVWLEPEKYASDGGFQIMQALYAIGNGGFFGKGLGNSTQKRFLPEAQNDMIFSIICEELGLFGAAMVTILFILLLYRLLFIARNAPDLFGSLIATGIFAHIALQVILNISVVINLIPTTGITLPFISYGGTSILFLMAEMGLALSVSRQIVLRD